MIAKRSLGFTASGLVIGLLSLGTVAGLAGAMPADWPLNQAHSAQPPVEPPSTPGPAAMERATCRVVGAPFMVDPADERLLWGRLQNAGAVTATLQALEVGWEGQAVLQSVLVRPEGGEVVPVHIEPATSPAILRLRDPEGDSLTMSPGAKLALGLRFDRADLDLAKALGPVIGYLAEGCAVPIGPAGAPQARCPLELEFVGVPAKEPNRVQLLVTNRSDQPAPLAALEVSWPAAVNGALVGLYVNDKRLYEFEKGLARSPAVIDLRRLDLELVLPPQTTARVRLEFERPAAREPYAITIATPDCAATTSTWVSGLSPDCGVEAVGFSARGDRAVLRLANSRPVTRTVAALDVFWPVPSVGTLAEVYVDGGLAWSGSADRSPASIQLAGGAAIGPRATAEVQLVFTPTAQVQQEEALHGDSGGDYSIIIHFGSGCQILFSTLAGSPLCSLSAGEIRVDKEAREARVGLTNAAATASLRLLAISWPAHNGALTGVWLGNRSLFDQQAEAAPSPRPYTIELAGQTAVVPRNQTQTLKLRFKDRVSLNGYMLSMSFEVPTGEACHLFVTSRQAEPECRLSLASPRVYDQRFADFDLVNEGRDAVELHFVQADWPNPDGTNGLNQVALVPGEGRPATIVWEPAEGDPIRWRAPARVFPNGDSPPILDAQSTVILRLRFSQLLERYVTAPDRDFKLTVGAVEDCQATYAQGKELPPQRVSFGGVVRELPQDGPGVTGLFGRWLIESQDEVRSVEVDRATQLDPATVTPKVGDIVFVEALASEEELRAIKITFRVVEPGTSLLGLIDVVDTLHDPPRWIVVTGRRVWILDTTVIEGELQVGAEVSVEGTRNPDDSIKASLIKVTRLPQGLPITVRGVIQSEPAVQVLEQSWPLDKYLVRVPDRLLPREVKSRPSRRPQPGERFEVTGHLQPGNVIIASQQPRLLPEPTILRLSGQLTALPPGGPLGDWTVETDDGQVYTFAVESLSILDTSAAPAAVGMRVRAMVQERGGGLVALRVRMSWP